MLDRKWADAIRASRLRFVNRAGWKQRSSGRHLPHIFHGKSRGISPFAEPGGSKILPTRFVFRDRAGLRDFGSSRSRRSWPCRWSRSHRHPHKASSHKARARLKGGDRDADPARGRRTPWSAPPTGRHHARRDGGDHGKGRRRGYRTRAAPCPRGVSAAEAVLTRPAPTNKGAIRSPVCRPAHTRSPRRSLDSSTARLVSVGPRARHIRSS